MTIPAQAANYLGLLIGKVPFQARRCLRNPDAEEVHDLRVAIRRLQQALRVFSGWLPKDEPRKIRRRLKEILRAAGSVRDLDIAMSLADSSGLPLRDELRSELQSGRETAAAGLTGTLSRFLESEFSAKSRSRLQLDSADRKAGTAMATLAREVLPDLAAEFIDAGMRLVERPKSKRKLHAFRLSAKRFRYSLEPFGGVYGRALDSRLKALRKVQDVLGRLSDANATRRILKSLGAPAEALRILREEETTRLAEFQALWPRLFDESAPSKWKRFLGRTPKTAQEPSK